MIWDKQRVLQLRKNLGLTQSEFARQLGCRQQTVSEWELGFYEPANAYGRLLDHLARQVSLNPSIKNEFNILDAEKPRPAAPFHADPHQTTFRNEVLSYDLDKPFDPAID